MLTAQGGRVAESGLRDPARKRAHAVRIPAGETITIDGRLNEGLWRQAPILSDFEAREPIEFGTPSDSTHVSFLFDEKALYVGAHLWSHDPGSIPRGVTRHDGFANSEEFTVSLDSYHDRRTAYSFSVTAGGVRNDYYRPRDTQDFESWDYTFDPVWEAKVTFDSTGWWAEMRIPFSQLRFNTGSDQIWGLNVNRFRPQLNESDYWVVVPRNEATFISHWGTLEGIQGIQPSHRIELLPYVASNGTFTGAPFAANPFDHASQIDNRLGIDLKMGLGPNLTLNAAINPDFGQVEADPAEVNLTGFETFFEERRPFFTEGAQLLRGNVPNYFYSRRIGARPHGEPVADFTEIPQHTQIISAAKVTGRLASGLSIGLLTAVTAREFANAYDSLSKTIARSEAEPASAYGVLRLEQQFAGSNSTAGFSMAGVHRSFAPGSPVAAQLSRAALAGGLDWVLRFKQGEFEFGGNVGGSYVAGDTAAIHLLQEDQAHYFQRPDVHHVHVDPTRTELFGYKATVRLDKKGGQHWLGGVMFDAESPGFETNDMGRLQHSDDLDLIWNVAYRENVPGPLFRRFTLGVNGRTNWSFGGIRNESRFTLTNRALLRNFAFVSLDPWFSPRSLSSTLTRGGPLMGTGQAGGIDASFNSNFLRANEWHTRLSGSVDEFGGWRVAATVGASFRPSASLGVSIEPRYTRLLNSRQYLTVDASGVATFGRRYVFGFIHESILSTQFRVNYAFSPVLTLEAYAEPFAASGRYDRIGELESAGSRNLRTYGTDGTSITRAPGGYYLGSDARSHDTFLVPDDDFNTLSFRSNLVLRWEWNRGSSLFLVWQQNRSGFCSYLDLTPCSPGMVPGTSVRTASLSDALRAPGNNFLALKISYWLPVN